eukprot:13978648-Ditylum_brightwellii.AAC.1
MKADEKIASHDLEFSVYNKENQTIKYTNSESCHRLEVFKAIPAGVFTCLGRLMLLAEENKNEKITNLYPDYVHALKMAGLIPKTVPTVQELYMQEKEKMQLADKNDQEKKKKEDKRNTFFVIGHSRFCQRGQSGT